MASSPPPPPADLGHPEKLDQRRQEIGSIIDGEDLLEGGW